MRWILKLYVKIRFGNLTEKVTDTVDGIPCESEFYDRKGRLVGLWAYGYFHPKYPYRGQGLK